MKPLAPVVLITFVVVKLMLFGKTLRLAELECLKAEPGHAEVRHYFIFAAR